MAEIKMAARIGWIGMGKMGLPICLRLRSAGFLVRVLCRNAAAESAATKNGFEFAHTIAHTIADTATVRMSSGRRYRTTRHSSTSYSGRVG